ncbi:hypothetical protein UFOVP276_68 [uncultured Caudovirales phage]|uniref:Uncharacterized protein n=1 Tax=uncultured Caudovirales phage TaxID=2100421 RepID=A0A6J5LNA8_9CAUD|nr:hypothetical protein UFOVP127_205 [uncultured Caudovirales phage]CAB4135092.1 hypothetical protein UFOVP276_68 [uncultured Caudovirales phage]
MADPKHSPAEFFCKFLISKKEYDTGTLMAILEDHQLASVSKRYLEELQEKMEPFPDPWVTVPNGDGENYQLTIDYLRKQNIYDLWFPTPAVNEAFKILGDPRLRENTEQLILSSMRFEEIVAKLNKYHVTSLTVDGVAAFQHYFWNRRLLSMAEWVAFMDNKPGSYNRITTVTASPDVQDMVVPWLSGMSGPPANINTGVVARRMRDVAFMKVLEIEKQPAGIVHSKMMKNYMDVITAAENEMRQSDVALKEVLQAFEKFRMKKTVGKVPSIEELAGVNYSQSGTGTDKMLVADAMLEEKDD